MKKNIKKLIALISAVLCLGNAAYAQTDSSESKGEAETATYEENINISSFPNVTAETAILIEKSTGRIIYGKDINKKMYPASMTKILTALVTLEYFDPTALITVGNEINEVNLDSSKAGHEKGETLTVENLIRGLIIPSGNDSANVLAAAVAKKVENNENLTYAECEKKFAELMNEKAKALGAKNSHFSNPHGYHNDSHYTTAYDMSLIASAALDNEIIKKIAGEQSFEGNGAGNNNENSTNMITNDYSWKSHNLLITGSEYSYQYATGIKTGFTDEAGDCLTASAEKDGTTLIAVLFNSEDPNRWLDAKNLFEFAFENYSLTDLQEAASPVEQVKLENHNRLNGDTLDAVVKENIKAYVTKDELDKIEKNTNYNEELTAENDGENSEIKLNAPISKDEKIGTVSFELDGKALEEADIYAASDIEKRTILSTVKFFFKDLKDKIFTVKGLIISVIIILVLAIIFLIFRGIRRRRNRSRYRYKMRKFR